MTTKEFEQTTEQIDEKFPYRFLLRWTWPDHIDRAIRRLMWAWLNDQASSSTDEIKSADFVATQLFWLIAVSPETPGAVLDGLSSSGSEAFLERIAENPNTWSSTLTKLAAHASARVRMAVADNPNTTAATILQLSNDQSVDIRYAVAENGNREVTILETLTQDENCHVAARSKKTLARLRPGECKAMPEQQNRQWQNKKTG